MKIGRLYLLHSEILATSGAKERRPNKEVHSMRKLAKLRAELKALGFSFLSGKGSHEIRTNPQHLHQRVVLYGRNGEDAHRYQAARIRKFRHGTIVSRHHE